MGDLLRKAQEQVTGQRGDSAANDDNGKAVPASGPTNERLAAAARLMVGACDARLQSSITSSVALLRDKADELERLASSDQDRAMKVRRLAGTVGSTGHQLSMEVAKAICALTDVHGAQMVLLRNTDGADADDAAAYEAMSRAIGGGSQ